MNDPKRFKFDTNEFYIKSADEMARLFAHAPHVVSGTMQFPERCNLTLNKIENPFPAFPVPEGETLDSYFAPVSYTHLDVYKRQIPRPSHRSTLAMAGAASSPAQAARASISEVAARVSTSPRTAASCTVTTC